MVKITSAGGTGSYYKSWPAVAAESHTPKLTTPKDANIRGVSVIEK